MNKTVSNFKECKVLVVGDLMLDKYLWGDVNRISPEAPVQVVSVNDEDYTLGGAGNVVNNLISLGAKVSAAGVIGTDSDGQLLLKKLNGFGVNTKGIIEESGRPTTRKTRIIAANQQVLRIDRETKNKISTGTFEAISEFIEKKISKVDVILISDYGKGLITRSLLNRLISAAKKHDRVIIADPKGLDFSKYSGVSLLTPNKKEASLASGIEIANQETLLLAGTKILRTAGLDRILITCGREGMVLFETDKKPYHIKAEALQVYDVSGAGDTVLAVLGLSVASGAAFEEGAKIANTAAGIVVGKVGTATVSEKELKTALHSYPDAAAYKYKSLPELSGLIHDLKKKGKKLVLTNGCFDLLHAGHIMLFSASKQFGDVLIVAIDDDDSVRNLKGSGRPVLSAKQRVSIISALDVVDYVVVFSSEELSKLIDIIQPDVLTKGSNYTTGEIFGRELVEQFGGRVVLIPVTEKISSTGIINNIKNNQKQSTVK